MSHVLQEKLDSNFFTFICVFVYTYIQMCKHHSAHVEVRGHLVEAGPFYTMWNELRSQAWWQVSLATDPSHWLLDNVFLRFYCHICPYVIMQFFWDGVKHITHDGFKVLGSGDPPVSDLKKSNIKHMCFAVINSKGETPKLLRKGPSVWTVLR